MESEVPVFFFNHIYAFAIQEVIAAIFAGEVEQQCPVLRFGERFAHLLGGFDSHFAVSQIKRTFTLHIQVGVNEHAEILFVVVHYFHLVVSLDVGCSELEGDEFRFVVHSEIFGNDESITILEVIDGGIFATLGGLVGIFAFSLSFQEQPVSDGRADLSYLELTAIDKKDIIDKNSSSSYKVVLSSSQIEKTFDKIFTYYNDGRDNACQIEINRILNSNASFAVKQKARNIMDYLEIPDFTTLKDVPTFSQVNENPFLYLDCWINWKGRISNAVQGENSFDCDFLVGYEDLKKVDGVVPLRFAESPEILIDQPLEVLAKISDDLGKIYLEGRAVHQNAKNLVNP